MTSDDWRRVEPLLAEALLLPADAQKQVIESSFQTDAIRRELLDVLRRTNVVLPHQSAAVRAGSSSHDPRINSTPMITAAPLLAANDTVADGRFHVIRQLGRGGMGEVYLASDTKLETLVALKVLRDVQTREAQHARLCSGHPHIATMHDVIEATIGDRLVTILVMEHVAGRPANAVMDDGAVRLSDAVRWARQVAAALAHAHECGVLHCDLKPANILITPAGAKVVDFGIGRATFDPRAAGGPLRGTLPYMAPELLTDGQFSRASDIYGLGVTIFELVTGRLPFEGEGPELVLRILGAPAPMMATYRSDVPRELEEIIACAIAKHAPDRYRSARAFENALASIDERQTAVRAQASGVWPRLVSAAAGVLALLMLVTFAGFVTSMLFNSALRRTAEFSNESAWDWPLWGVRALLAAGLVTALVAGTVVTAKWLCSLVATLPGLRSPCLALRKQVRTLLARIAPSSTVARAQLLLAAHITFLLVFGWYFQDIFEGLDSFISQRPPVDLSALNPDNQPRHIWFELVLCLQVWIFGLLWWRLLRRDLRSPDHRNARIAATGLTITAVALFVGQVVPFRIIYHNVAERVLHRSQVCYIVGLRGTDALLFCPIQSPPWSRVVSLNDPALQRDGTVENMFSEVQRPRSGR